MGDKDKKTEDLEQKVAALEDLNKKLTEENEKLQSDIVTLKKEMADEKAANKGVKGRVIIVPGDKFEPLYEIKNNGKKVDKDGKALPVSFTINGKKYILKVGESIKSTSACVRVCTGMPGLDVKLAGK